MSLINKVLQDLDHRQPAGAASSLEGGAAVRVAHGPTAWQRKRPQLLGLGAALALAFGAWSWWMPAGTVMPAITAQAAAAPPQQPLTVTGQASGGLTTANPALASMATASPAAAEANAPVTAATSPGASVTTSHTVPVLDTAPPAPTATERVAPVGARPPVSAAMAAPAATARDLVPLSALRAPTARPARPTPATTAADDAAAASPRSASEGAEAAAAPRAPAGGKTYSPKQLRANLMAEALQFDRQGRHDEARAVLRRLLAEFPDDASARLMQAQLQLEAGHVEEARSVLAQGLQLTPAHPGMTQAFARLEAEAGRVEAAIGMLEAIEPAVRADAQYQSLLAALLLQVHRFDAATQRYLVALRADPGQVRWLIGVGVALEGLGRKSEALEAYQRAEAAPGLTAELAGFVDQRLAQLRR